MNKNQIKGIVKNIVGNAQQIVGKAIDNKGLQINGLRKQTKGNAEKVLGDAKPGVKNIRDTIKRVTNPR